MLCLQRLQRCITIHAFAMAFRGVGLDNKNSGHGTGYNANIGIGPLLEVAPDFIRVGSSAPWPAITVLGRFVRHLRADRHREYMPAAARVTEPMVSDRVVDHQPRFIAKLCDPLADDVPVSLGEIVHALFFALVIVRDLLALCNWFNYVRHVEWSFFGRAQARLQRALGILF